jgi:hypothetical protein
VLVTIIIFIIVVCNAAHGLFAASSVAAIFDILTVRFPLEFCLPLVVVGVDGSLQTLLDISGHEIYSAVFTSLREISITLTILVAALLDENVELKHVGFMFLINVSVFLILNIAYIACMGFWRKYYCGMIYSCALAASTTATEKRVACFYAFSAFCFILLAAHIIALDLCPLHIYRTKRYRRVSFQPRFHYPLAIFSRMANGRF